MTKRISQLVAAAVAWAALAIVVTTYQPFRAWASQEGSYLYHAIFVNGPAVVYSGTNFVGNDGVTYIGGLTISSGTQSSHAGALASYTDVGPFTTAIRVPCVTTTKGYQGYDITVNSYVFCDGTGWHKLVTGVGTNDTWTTY